MGFSLTPDQQAAVDNRGGGLLVSAAAGSGKTKVLVERLMKRVVEDGEDLDHFLIITYTRAAAAELRGKIIDALNERLAEEPGSRHLRRQSTLVYRTQISTIHSFCQTVLKEDGHRIDLPSDFRVIDDMESVVLRRQVLTGLIEEMYESVQAGDAFSVLLDTISSGWDDSRLMEIVLGIYAKIQSHPEPDQWIEEQIRQLQMEGVSDAGQTAWGKLIMAVSRRQADYWHSQLSGLLDALDQDEQLQNAYVDTIWTLMDSLDDFIAALDTSWDKAVAFRNLTYGRLKHVRSPDDPMLAARVKKVKKRCKNRMDKVTQCFEQSSDELLEDMRLAAPPVIELLRLTQRFSRAFAEEKQRRQLADFSDLEHLTLTLLTGTDGRFSETALKLSGRYTEVMVDEYQDTNQVQNAIFDRVSDHGRKLFMVGDVKQSIYRFNLADPTIFMERFLNFPYYTEVTEGQPRKVVLSKNFRSRKSVLDACNFVFRSLMSREFGEIDYTSDHYLYQGLEYPEQPLDRTELTLVDLDQIKAGEGEPRVSAAAVEADYIARRIRRLMDDRHPITEEDHFRPVEWNDIVILYRSPGSVLPDLIAAMEAQGVPWQADSGSDFFAKMEISVALSFLRIVDNPHQDISLISVLRSPLYGFTPDQLAEIRCADRESDYYSALVKAAESGNEACSAFLRELDDLRFQAADESASQVLWQIYEQTGMTAVFRSLSGGETRRDNLLLLYEYARQYEASGCKSLFEFLTRIRRMEESGKSITVSGTYGSGVRIMSIHKSKGLEFPVVVLGGLCREFNRTDEKVPMLFHSKLGVGPKGMDLERKICYPTLARTAVKQQLEQELCAEELRLLYVAMTRAREKLIMVGTERNAEKVLERLTPFASFPMEPQALFSMNTMGAWVLSAAMAREEGACLRRGAEVDSVYRGADRSWIIRIVDGNRPETFFKRNAAKKTHGEYAPNLDGISWSYPAQGVENLPSKLTATQLKGRFRDEEAAEGTQTAHRPASFRRPDFAQRERPLNAAEAGTALHLFMQLCDPDRASTVAGSKEELSRLCLRGCMTEAQKNACDPSKSAAFFRSPLGVEARRQGMEREFKFSMLTDAEPYYGAFSKGEEVLLQGVIDLWYQTIEGITVVDFKTDRVQPGREKERAERYRTQLEVYSRALSRITGLPVAHRWLWFFRTDTPVEL